MDREEALDVLYNPDAPLGAMDSDQRKRYAQAVVASKDPATYLTARFKLEVHICPFKGQRGTYIGMLYMLLSGSDSHFDNDQPVYMCPVQECRRYILPTLVAGGVWMCPSCGTVGYQDQTKPDGSPNPLALSDGTLFRASDQTVAKLLYDRFLLLDQDCHVMLRRHKAGNHKWVGEYMRGNFLQAMKMRERGQLSKEWAIYPAERIRQDNLASKDMVKQFLKFLRA